MGMMSYREPVRLAVLVSGRGSNFAAILEEIRAGKLNARVTVCISDNPCAPALKRAEAAGVPVRIVDPRNFEPARRLEMFERSLLEAIDSAEPDLVVLAGFMRIVPAAIVRKYRNRMMNIHPSLLPAFPGLRAQEQALRYGVKITGCTVHFVDEGMDTGPIILQKAVPVMDDDTVETLSDRILIREHSAYPEAIGLFASGRLKVEGRRVRIIEPQQN